MTDLRRAASNEARDASSVGGGLRVALVAMPWAQFDLPSPAIGTLAATLRRDAPQCQLSCRYAYLELYQRLTGLDAAIYERISMDSTIGDFIYAAQLYPDKRASVLDAFTRWVDLHYEAGPAPEQLFDEILCCAGQHLEELACSLGDGRHDVIGFSTSFCQLFSSLAAARAIRQRDPAVTIVLGGMGVAHHLGSSVLQEFPFVDYAVQGEGEGRLLVLLEQLARGARPCDERGILAQQADSGSPAAAAGELPSETSLPELDELPIPDYSEYAALADQLSIRWDIPLEGSRGCWWDRVHRTGDPSDACYFCGLNTVAYRKKSEARVASEVQALSERHESVRFRFVDNTLRPAKIGELCRCLGGLGKNLQFTHELRASVRPEQILALWEVGLRAVQVGVEGLCTAYLRRIGKGTTTIQNLQAMRWCYELGIDNDANLLTHFPGATQEEVDETARNITSYAMAYQPTTLGRFQLQIGSTVHRVADRFGVANIRNAALYQDALPGAVWRRLALFWLDYDDQNDQADWRPVEQVWRQWRALHEQLVRGCADEWINVEKPLYYNDGGSFLEIVDHRGDHRLITLDALWREVYLFCARIRGRESIERRFAGRCEPSTLDEIVTGLTSERLMFSEGASHLSLAVAPRPDLALRRERRQRARGD